MKCQPERADFVEVARNLVEVRYPSADLAFVAGSVVRGQGTETSDLDVVVIGPEGPYRESLIQGAWPVEAFVHTEASLKEYFASDVRSRRPSLPQMCAEGIILIDRHGRGSRIQAEAQEVLRQGPPPLTASELETLRYHLTDKLDDLVGCQDQDELRFIGAELVQEVSAFILSVNGRWTGRGKWSCRALKQFEPRTVLALSAALEALCCHGDKTALIVLTEAALAPVGGRLFEGFTAGRPGRPA